MSDERAIGERLVKALKRPAIGGPTALVVLLVIAFYGWSFTCPCERTPGAVLFGYEQPFPVDDWTFANDVTLCQIQINAGFRPHAINLNCFANDEGGLYLSCSSCDGKLWSGFAIRDPRAWLRLDGNVYPVHLTRIVDHGELDMAWVARLDKLHSLEEPANPPAPLGSPRPEGWWTFRVRYRG